MDSESYVRREFRKRVEGWINPSTTTRIPSHFFPYLLVGGILEKDTGSLSKRKIKYILKEWLFRDTEIKRAETFLTDKGWIIPGEGGKWLTLSESSRKLIETYEQRIERKVWEETVNFILQKSEEFEFDTPLDRPLGKIRSLVRKIGEDLVIYADKGEEKRVMYALKAIEKMGGGYRKVYILHAPKNDDFVERVKKEVKKFSHLPLETIETEMWRKENFKRILEIVDDPRRQLDILITAMPRACIIQLYRALNYPTIACLQNWYYNKAKRYVYNKKGYVTEVEVLERGSKKEKLISFGENVLTRFEDEMFYDLVGDSVLTLMGRADYNVHSGSYNIKEIEIDQRTEKMVDKCCRGNIQLVGKIEPFDVDYDSVWSVLQFLNHYRPDTIWVSGNRVTALGIAMYWVGCLTSGRRISIFAPHVEAENYSEDAIPDLKLILPVPFDGFLVSPRRVV
jgi:hypothetical protein